MSKVMSEDEKLIVQDRLYKLYIDLKASSKRESIIENAIAKRISLEDMNEFINEMRITYKLPPEQNFAGIMAEGEKGAVASAGQEAVHEAAKKFTYNLLMPAAETSEKNVELFNALADKHLKGLANIFGWLPLEYHQQFIENLSQKASAEPLEDTILTNLFHFEEVLNNSFQVPENKNFDSARSAIENYVKKLPEATVTNLLEPDRQVIAEEIASSPEGFKFPKQFDSLDGAYSALQTAQAELAEANKEFSKISKLITKVHKAIKASENKDQKVSSAALEELKGVEENKVLLRHKLLANSLQEKAEQVKDIIDSTVIQDDIENRSKQTWLETAIDAQKRVTIPSIKSLREDLANVDEYIKKVAEFHEMNNDITGIVERKKYGIALQKFLGNLEKSKRDEIIGKSDKSLKDMTFRLMNHLITEGSQSPVQSKQSGQLSEKDLVINAVISELTGFSPEAQKQILNDTIKTVSKKLEANSAADFIIFVNTVREECKKSPEFTSVSNGREAANKDRGAGILIPAISRDHINEMYDGLQPLFASNSELIQRKKDVEDAKLHLTLKDAPKIALFIAQQIALGTYRNPVVRATFFSTVGAVLGAGATALGIGGQAKEAIEMAAKTSSKVAALIKEGKDVQSAALLAGADVGYDLAISTLGLQAPEAAKAEFMGSINALIDEINNPKRILEIEGEVKKELEAKEALEVASAGNSSKSKDKKDKSTIVSELAAERLLSSLMGRLSGKMGIPEAAKDLVKEKLKSPLASMIDKAGRKARGVLQEKLTPKEEEAVIAAKAKENIKSIPEAVKSIADNLNKAFRVVIESQAAQNSMPLGTAVASAAVAASLQTAVDMGKMSLNNAKDIADFAATQLQKPSGANPSSASVLEVEDSPSSSGINRNGRVSELPSPASSRRNSRSSSDISSHGGIRAEVLDEAANLASPVRANIGSRDASPARAANRSRTSSPSRG